MFEEKTNALILIEKTIFTDLLSKNHTLSVKNIWGKCIVLILRSRRNFEIPTNLINMAIRIERL